MYILGIETSCDETAASVVHINENSGFIKPLSNVISSQIKLHAKWGGVVPNLAAREHLKNILPVIQTSLDEAGLAKDNIDLLAITQGPGLIPALLVGTSTAKTIAYAWKKPLLGIHHIEGHIYANFLNKQSDELEFPALCLVVSGGHTQLILMSNHLDYTIIGETQDDAVGEAFDKVARILNLDYPGGPIVAQKANAYQPNKSDPEIKFPRPMLNNPSFNFSFSGLKTAVLYLIKKNPEKISDEQFIQQVCFEFQKASVEVLTIKTILAATKYHPRTILLAGGVSANTYLQNHLQTEISKSLPEIKFHFPEKSFQMDNAAMIATAAFFRYTQNKKTSTQFNYQEINTNANLKL